MSNSLLGFCVQVGIITDFRSEEERGVYLYFVFNCNCHCNCKLSPWILRTSQLILTSGVKRRGSYCVKSLVFFGKSSDFHAIFFSDLCYILWNPLNLHHYYFSGLSTLWSVYKSIDFRSQRVGSILLCIYLFFRNKLILFASFIYIVYPFNW